MIFDQPYFAYPDRTDLKPNFNTSFLNYDEAIKLNQQRYAIAIIPNVVKVGRGDSDVIKIRSWFCDIDYVNRPKMPLDELLEYSPLLPSYVVESKNGYHLYFLVRHQFEPKIRYIEQQKGIIQYFKADPKCYNFARLMRAPGFVHNKSEPFDVKIVWQLDVKYTEGQIERYFPYIEPDADISSADVADVKFLADGDNDFDKVRHYDSRIILQALSGNSAVGGERYTFKRTGKGHHNIEVNGKGTSCFINEKGNVIGDDQHRGGAIEWLTYYGHTRPDALKIIKEVMSWE